MSDWRDRLSRPQKPRTLPEMMLLALDMAAEDAVALEETPPNSSARREFFELAGFDLYERIGDILRSIAPEERGDPIVPHVKEAHPDHPVVRG